MIGESDEAMEMPLSSGYSSPLLITSFLSMERRRYLGSMTFSMIVSWIMLSKKAETSIFTPQSVPSCSEKARWIYTKASKAERPFRKAKDFLSAFASATGSRA